MSVELKSIPLVVQPSNRGVSTDTDAKLVNAVVERQPDGSVQVFRRPALRYSGTITPVPSSTYLLKGLFNKDVFDNYAVYYDVTALETRLYLAQWFGTPSPLANLTTIVEYDWEFSINRASPPQILLTAGTRAWYINTSVDTVTEITSWAPAGSGFHRVGPMVYLDGLTFVLMANGHIWNCNVNDVTTWSALNFIQVRTDSDIPRAIQKQLTHIVAFKDYSIEFFYNAARPQGSPLARNDSAKIDSVGLYDVRTLQRINDSLVWVAQNRLGRKSIAIMEGLRYQDISSPNIDRILSNLLGEPVFETLTSVGFSCSGHDFYMLSLVEHDIVLVYDLTSKAWSEWTSGAIPGLTLKYMTLPGYPFGTWGKYPILYDGFSTKIFEVIDNVYQDSSSTTTNVSIPVDIYTPLWDQQVRIKKHNVKLEVHGDQNSAGTVQVRTTDNDYKDWGPVRDMSLADGVATSPNWGTFRRRGWHISNNENVPFRVTNLIAHISLGTT